MSFHWTERLMLGGDLAPATGRVVSPSIRLTDIKIGEDLRDVVIRLAESSAEMQSAANLVNDRYEWRGYGIGHRIPSSSHHVTLTAEVDGAVVGTITLAVDSAHGLAVDKTFKDRIDQVRELSDSNICELTKFAFDPAARSKELMASLFHVMYIYGYRTFGCTDLFIEVNPRHVRFYETALGFECVGSERTNASVDAPAQLMRLKVSAIAREIDRSRSEPARAGRSLYPLFLSPAQEAGIYERLTRNRGALHEDTPRSLCKAHPCEPDHPRFPYPAPLTSLRGDDIPRTADPVHSAIV